MGYRNYFYLVPKKIVNDIKEMDTNKQLAEYVAKSKHFHECQRKEAKEYLNGKTDSFYIGIYDMGERLHEFGKLYFDGDTYEAITKNSQDLFKKGSELEEEFEDFEAKIVGEDALRAVAECYLKKVLNNYKDLLKTPEELIKEKEEKGEPTLWVNNMSVEDKLKEDVKEKIWWLRNNPLNLNKDEKYSISNSWLYEYNMFELAHQLKVIDFKKYDIIECGW